MKAEVFNKYYAAKPHFRIENPNPRWRKKKSFEWDAEDCVIRALANATRCSWVEAFDILATEAKKQYRMMDDPEVIKAVLLSKGAKWTSCKAVKGEKRMTVLKFAENHPKGRYILSVAHHESVCIDGVIVDAWNCGDKCCYGYFDMKNFIL